MAVVAFISQKGGTGKSTLARALAAIVAHAGLAVRIADLDPQQSTVIEWEKLRHDTKLAPIPVEAFDEPQEAIASGEEGELLILDTPAHADHKTLAAAEEADLVVQPSSGSVDDLRPAVLVFNELVARGVPKTRLVVALCRVTGEREEAAARAYLKAAGYEVLPGSIPEKLGYKEAHNRGHAVSETTRALREHVDTLMAALFDKVCAQLAAKRRRRFGRGREKRA
ncbi:MAG: AAA family ATPase [Hyphomicrobiaceae bacterium]